MAKEIEEIEEEPTKVEDATLVGISQDTGFGIKLPDGTVADLSGSNVGQAQVLAYLVKTISEIRKQM